MPILPTRSYTYVLHLISLYIALFFVSSFSPILGFLPDLPLSPLCEAQAREPETHNIPSSFKVFCRIASLIAAHTRRVIEVSEDSQRRGYRFKLTWFTRLNRHIMYFAALAISLRLCSPGSSLPGDPCAVVPRKVKGSQRGRISKSACAIEY